MRRMLLPACAAALLAGAAGAETADEFAARVNRELQEVGIETGRAEWVQRTYITPDTDAIASRAGEREQAVYARLIAESKAFDGQPQSADAARTIKLLRISQDAPAKQKKFDEKYSLGFPLLADTEHEVAEKFGVWGEKKNYGRTYMGIIRSAFLIDEKGKVAEAWYKISPKDTPIKLLKALEG